MTKIESGNYARDHPSFGFTSSLVGLQIKPSDFFMICNHLFRGYIIAITLL